MTHLGNVEATVVIADDDALVRMVLRRAVAKRGNPVVEASDGAEALAAVAASGAPLIVLDANMPGGDLHETLDRLRSDHPDVEILVMSGDDRLAPTLPAGVSFLAKPLDLTVFYNALDRMLPA